MFEKKHTHSPWLDIAVFAAMVAFFLFSASRLTGRNRTDTQESPMQKQERAPATAPVPDSPAAGVSEIHLECVSDQPRKVETESSFLKLNGKLCQKDQAAVLSAGKGRNLASGAEILCFVNPQEQRFATNFFQLRPGSNPIELEIRLSNGRSRQTRVDVFRR